MSNTTKSDHKNDPSDAVKETDVVEGVDCYIITTYDTIHVYPMEDVRPHNVSGCGVCWCDPYFDYDGLGNRVCVHQQFDNDQAAPHRENYHS